MKVKILQGFGDKYNGTLYETGQVVDFTDERAAELIADPRGLAEAIEEPKQAPSAPKAKPTPKGGTRKRSEKK